MYVDPRRHVFDLKRESVSVARCHEEKRADITVG